MQRRSQPVNHDIALRGARRCIIAGAPITGRMPRLRRAIALVELLDQSFALGGLRLFKIEKFFHAFAPRVGLVTRIAGPAQMVQLTEELGQRRKIALALLIGFKILRRRRR